MSDPFRLRRATADDSRRAFDVFLPAIRDLADRLNQPWEVDPDAHWARTRDLYEHLAATAAEWWMADDLETGEPIGYARSIQRGGLFELTEFFVRPNRQAAGVGAALLERAFPEGRGDVRAIIATTDVRAQARYYRAGTVARFPIVALVGGPGTESAMPSDVDVVRLTGDVAELDAVRRIDAAVLEFDRGDELDWLVDRREGYLYLRNGEPVGFGFVARGATGPVAALEACDQPAILTHLLARSAALGSDEASFEVPMVNSVAVTHLLARGFRMDPFFTFLMSSRPFGRFDRYIGFSPPFVL